MNTQVFISRVADVSLKDVFNPYSNTCSEHDLFDAPCIRRRNLAAYLDAVVVQGVESIWVGRDCGYRGGRRTGIALTDEMHLPLLSNRFGVEGVVRATSGEPVRERTATEVWKILSKMHQPIFLWNAFPFHPHEHGKTMSNRCHSAREFRECKDLLADVIQWLRPSTIVALGVDAEKAIRAIGKSPIRVRHPSYGGQFEFAATLQRFYRISH